LTHKPRIVAGISVFNDEWEMAKVVVRALGMSIRSWLWTMEATMIED
jgi:hypothetical protein